MDITPGNYTVRAILKQKGLRGGVTIALDRATRSTPPRPIPKITAKWAEYKANPQRR